MFWLIIIKYVSKVFIDQNINLVFGSVSIFKSLFSACFFSLGERLVQKCSGTFALSIFL